jgi:hypothetical protein
VVAHHPHPQVGGGSGPPSHSRLRTSRSRIEWADLMHWTRHRRSRHGDIVVEEDRRHTHTFSDLLKPASIAHVVEILGERTGMAAVLVCHGPPPPVPDPHVNTVQGVCQQS